MARRDATHGDDAFRAFATAAAPGLFRSAYLLTGDWHLAEDLVQDTLARMYAMWARIARIDNPRAYAHTVLARRFVSVRRRRSASERPVSVLPERPADGPNADLALSLRAALADLPERDRAVIVLRYLADLPVADVARALGRSESAVKIQSMRALTRLRAACPELIEH